MKAFEEDVFVYADKSTNVYETSPDNYNKLLMENITKKTLNQTRNSVLLILPRANLEKSAKLSWTT